MCGLTTEYRRIDAPDRTTLDGAATRVPSATKCHRNAKIRTRILY